MGNKLDLTTRILATMLAIVAILYFVAGGPAVKIAEGLAAFTLTPTFILGSAFALALGALAGAVTTYTDWNSLVSWNSALAPFGMRPIYDQSGRVRARGYQNGIISGLAANIYQYTPIKLVTATYNTAAVATVSADFIGVLDGVEYTDANGRRQYSKMWPSGLAPLTTGSPSTWTVWIWDDPRTIFEIQANGALGEVAGRGVAGQQVDLIAGTGTGGVGAGSATTQLSSAAADASSLSSSGQKMLRIIDKARYVDNDWGDAFPILQVQIAMHQNIANKVAV